MNQVGLKTRDRTSPVLTLAHLSDLHLGPLPDHTGIRLTAKQRTGRRNWRSGREAAFDPRTLTALITDIHGARVDHIAVTGDLINIGLDEEVVRAAAWLRDLGDPERVSLVPGNHDAYVRMSLVAHATAWADYMSGDDGLSGQTATFPFVRRRDGVALIGISTAITSPVLMATGRVGHEQLKGVDAALAATGEEGLARFVMIHHPPDRNSTAWHKRLTDASALRKILRRRGAELVLHGHNHRNRVSRIERDGPDIPVVGVAAAALRPSPDRPGGCWNRIEIERRGAEHLIRVAVRAISHGGQAGEIGRVEFAIPAG